MTDAPKERIADEERGRAGKRVVELYPLVRISAIIVASLSGLELLVFFLSGGIIIHPLLCLILLFGSGMLYLMAAVAEGEERRSGDVKVQDVD